MPDLERERRLRSKQKLDTRLEFILSGEGYGKGPARGAGSPSRRLYESGSGETILKTRSNAKSVKDIVRFEQFPTTCDSIQRLCLE